MPKLTFEQIEFYKSNGYILLPGLLSADDLREVSEEYDALFGRKKAESGKLEAMWTGDWSQDQDKTKTSVLSIHNLQLHSAVFTKLLLHEDMMASVLELMEACVDTKVSSTVSAKHCQYCHHQSESTSVVLHHTKAHLKPAREGAPFPTHQDYHYFPYRHHSMMAIFVHLDDTEPSNGGLAIFPGSHHQGPQQDVSTSPAHHYVDQARWPLSAATPVHAKAGDVLIFSYLLVHGRSV